MVQQNNGMKASNGELETKIKLFEYKFSKLGQASSRFEQPNKKKKTIKKDVSGLIPAQLGPTPPTAPPSSPTRFCLVPHLEVAK